MGLRRVHRKHASRRAVNVIRHRRKRPGRSAVFVGVLWVSIVLCTAAPAAVLAQSNTFPMDEYRAAVRSRNFAAITAIVKKYGTNTSDVLDTFRKGEPILLEAVKANDVELVRVLLEADIPRELSDGLWDVPLFSYPIKADQFEMVKLLAEYYPITPAAASAAVRFGRGDMIEYFENLGFGTHGVFRYGGPAGTFVETYTLFNTAIDYGQIELATEFLDAGHSINSLNVFAEHARAVPGILSALDIARRNGDENIVDRLIARGAESGFEILHAMGEKELDKRFGSYRRRTYGTTVNDLRYREAPVLEAKVIGLLRLTDTLYVVCRSIGRMEIDDFNDHWYYVISESGKRGWAYGGYLEQRTQ